MIAGCDDDPGDESGLGPDGAFAAVVAFEGGGEFAVEVADPLVGDPGRERLLALVFRGASALPVLGS